MYNIPLIFTIPLHSRGSRSRKPPRMSNPRMLSLSYNALRRSIKKMTIKTRNLQVKIFYFVHAYFITGEVDLVRRNFKSMKRCPNYSFMRQAS